MSDGVQSASGLRLTRSALSGVSGLCPDRRQPIAPLSHHDQALGDCAEGREGLPFRLALGRQEHPLRPSGKAETPRQCTMPRIHTHRDRSILIFEDPQEPMEIPAEGTYVVCRFGNGFSGHWIDETESIQISGPKPLSTPDEAITSILESLDRLWESEERERVTKFETSVAQAALPAPRPEDAVFWNGETSFVQMPLEVILRLLNAVPVASPVRLEAVEALKRSPDVVVTGIVETAGGDLTFDTRRYTMAIYRRKQQRRAVAAMELLKKAVQEIATVNDFLDLEQQAGTAQELAVDGQALVPLPEAPTGAFAAVNQALPQALAGASNVQLRLVSGVVTLSAPRAST